MKKVQGMTKEEIRRFNIEVFLYGGASLLFSILSLTHGIKEDDLGDIIVGVLLGIVAICFLLRKK